MHFLSGFYRLYTEKEFSQIIKKASGERVVVLASAVLEIGVAFVVEHLVGCQVHGGVQQLMGVCKNVVNCILIGKKLYLGD